MFAIVASSFALAVYMVKLLKELVEPSDIFLQCLRSHLSVPSTEVRGRGPVSRRHRDHAICVGKGSTRGFDIRISSKCCLRKGFFCPKHPRCYEPRQSSQSVDWTETLASVATWMVLIVVSAFAIIAYRIGGSLTFFSSSSGFTLDGWPFDKRIGFCEPWASRFMGSGRDPPPQGTTIATPNAS
ncbi:uncharacterized protein [Dermacentor andersoni]|uniref:uncharacterized protein isoform X6 n=1 Tax=Dermacentor andersoni TaxID=34620 RepID=UPI00241747FC|nr:uncharacterized protein LOC129382271 isoform X7 [Dermacentor andersoni]